MKSETALDACKRWVSEFNAIPQALLERAYRDEERVEQVQLLAGGDRVCQHCGRDDIRPLTSDETEEWSPDDDEQWCKRCEMPRAVEWRGSQDAWPAMWGTCWTFENSSDEEWAREHADEIAARCGIHVFEADDLGIFLAIDGAGYDFYDSHWLPLYRLRGLEWHDASTESAVQP